MKLQRRILSPIKLRTFNELVMGSKTYMPKSPEEQRSKDSLDKERIKLRKAQSLYSRNVK